MYTTRIKLILIITTVFMVVSCKEQNTKTVSTETSKLNIEVNSEIQFKNEKADKVFGYYIQLKRALVDGESKRVLELTKNLEKLLVDDKPFKDAVSRFSGVEDIEEQREIFSDITIYMENVLNESLSSGKVYKQYCPMAFNNIGGYWLSDEKQIRNPYFGDRMLKCGNIAQVIQ